MAKKLNWFQCYFPGLLGTSPMSKQETNFFLQLDFRDNPIYLFWDADEHDLEIFLRCQKLHFLQLSNIAIMSYGHFPTRNGLKSFKGSKSFWHFQRKLLAPIFQKTSQVLSICLPKWINGIISEVQLQKKKSKKSFLVLTLGKFLEALGS